LRKLIPQPLKREISLLLVLITTFFFLSGCGSMPKPMRNLGKSDVDFVMDVHAKQQKQMLMELTRKLYVRNPCMVGLTEMLRRSYNHQQEFFIIDSLNEQSLYNSARNIEIFVWRLYQRRDSKGELFLLSNRMGESDYDISFDRLFSKDCCGLIHVYTLKST